MRIVSLLLALCAIPAMSQTLTEGLEQTYELQASLSTGNTPLWLNSNRYGLSSLSSVNGYMRGRVERPLQVDAEKEMGIGYGLDLAVPLHYTSDFVIQQCYAEVRYKHGVLTLGQKQQPMHLKNMELSSGSQTLGINARPIPEFRLSFPEYWSIPGLHDWLAIKGHVSYGWLTDGSFQENWTKGISHYAKGVRYHSKSGFMRIGPDNEDYPLNLEMGLEMACEFGGTLYNTEFGKVRGNSGFKSYVDAFYATGKDEVDETYHNVGGNQLGSWLARLNYQHDDFSLSLYIDHFFEDHSSMFFLDYDGYGVGEEWNSRKDSRYLLYPLKDLLLGAELKISEGKWVNGAVLEFMNTRYQSGPIYHDHNPGLSDHIGGDDNYYNHYLYQGWSHWGQVMGNPLYRSPLYNEDNSLTIENNRFYAWHLGLMGDPLENLHYRLLASWQKGYGTYQGPFLSPMNNLSLMAEATYAFQTDNLLKNCALRGSVGLDYGDLLGNSLGVQLTFIYHLRP